MAGICTTGGREVAETLADCGSLDSGHVVPKWLFVVIAGFISRANENPIVIAGLSTPVIAGLIRNLGTTGHQPGHQVISSHCSQHHYTVIRSVRKQPSERFPRWASVR
ncbi:MAG: hypothetical protein FWD27_02080 [Coriobacteriia bacterium]|nr:hypothetical protein [Coriobacteriia bacterium]